MAGQPLNDNGHSPMNTMIFSSVADLNQLNFGDDEKTYPVSSTDDFTHVGEMGKGYFGVVSKFIHKDSGRTLAGKQIWINNSNPRNMDQLILELKVMLESRGHSNIVFFYGALVTDGFFWILMQLMDCSLHRFYSTLHANSLPLPESVLMHIAISAIKGLQYLKDTLNILHRDVKPQNILLSRKGDIKLCDFGVSGRLVNSVLSSDEKGTRMYYSPERLEDSHYGVKADVWALGLTLTEVANGRFPFSGWENDRFVQINDLTMRKVKPEPLNAEMFSADCRKFISSFLEYDRYTRPRYANLLEDSYLVRMAQAPVDETYFARIIDLL